MSYGVNFLLICGPCCYLRGQNFKGRQARRTASRTADKVRVHHQPQSGKTDRPDNSAERAGAGG